MKLPHLGSDKGYLTITVGVATSGAEPIESAALLVRRADMALYAGKAAGRDRSIQAADVEPDGERWRVAG